VVLRLQGFFDGNRMLLIVVVVVVVFVFVV
jgi:hypothetical protein